MINKELLKGILIPNIFALVVIVLTKLATNASDLGPILIASDFILLPLAMGIMSAYHWQKLKLRTKQRLKYSLLTSCVTIFFSAFFMGEGYICLLIVFPLLYGFLITGIFIGKYMFERKNNKLNMSVGILILLIFLVDLFSPHVSERMVADELLIHAPIENVWKNVVGFDSIQEPPRYWLFQIGMPKPLCTTVEGYYQGAGRKCIFTNGLVFNEKMIVFNPPENLTFDITEQPKDPELLGHIKITRGQFILKRNKDNTTTLIGNSWYSLYVFPTWYFDLWAESITRNVHTRVMEHIKKLSEKKL